MGLERVVVTGMGVVSPVGNGVDAFWAALCAGKSGIRHIEAFAEAGLRCTIGGVVPDFEVAGMGPKEQGRRDRYTLLSLAAADEAWAQSGINIDQVDPTRCGVTFGSGIGGIDTVQDAAVTFVNKGARRVSPFAVPKCLANMAAGEIALRHGLLGPNKAVVTACASGAQCVAEACNLIRLGQADLVVAGGAESAVIPFGIGCFDAMRALSRRNDEPERASRPFDIDREGFVMGEGGGVLVLESESHAKARGATILAVISGHGETCDAHHITAPRPDGSGAAGAMRAALRLAEVTPGGICYFNAHGTGTKYNDISESIAVRDVFGETGPPVSSTKSMTGHLLGGAGAIELIACIQSIQTGVMHPSINCDTLDPECPVNLITGDAREGKVDHAMSNSMGFGGHNVSVVVSRHGA